MGSLINLEAAMMNELEAKIAELEGKQETLSVGELFELADAYQDRAMLREQMA